MIFNFFLQSYRKNILTFGGENVDVIFDINGDDGMLTYMKYENGEYSKGGKIITKHPNIVRSVITGKKSWGLFLDEWTDGINEWLFTREEILYEFEKRNIKIPDSFLLDFENTIQKKRLKRIEKYLEELNTRA